MPGIVGLITNRPRAVAESELRAMVESLRHEPFYTSGTWIDAEQGVYVGWVARRGSFTDAMPLRNESGDITMVFSGEEFPEPGAVAGLRARGHQVEPHGASYLQFHRAEEEADFPKGLNGRFHGLLADHARGAAMLFNDRFGLLQRLYYHETKDTFYFAAQAISNPESATRGCAQWIPRGAGEFIVCGCVLENRTLFSGIHVLPPGSSWYFRGGRLEKKAAYFEPREWEEEEPYKPEDYFAHLRDVFVRNLPRYFNGNELVGVSLTGGLDTRIIMAWTKAPPGSLPCYTFGSMFRDNQDVQLARRVAKICEQPHQVIPTGSDFLSRFAHYAERSIYLTDACVDVSRSPDLYLNEKAREIAPVRMVGVFGSEMLLNSVMFKAVAPAAGLFHTRDLAPHGSIAQPKETYNQIRQVHPLTFIAFRQSPWHHYGVLGLEQSQVAVRSPYIDNDVVKTVYKSPGSTATNEEGGCKVNSGGKSQSLPSLRTDPWHWRGSTAQSREAFLSSCLKPNTPTIMACRNG